MTSVGKISNTSSTNLDTDGIGSARDRTNLLAATRTVTGREGTKAGTVAKVALNFLPELLVFARKAAVKV